MLNTQQVLQYVKKNLGFPFMFIEWSDEEIIDYIKTYSLKEYSHYFPDVNKVVINLWQENTKVPGVANEWYIIDPQGIEILNVKHMYTNMSPLIAMGHPPMGPFTEGELNGWSLDVNVSMMTYEFSNWKLTYEFTHPNIIRISSIPLPINSVCVEYERQQPTDFRGISNDIQMYFLELALADILIAIGRIRKRYGDGNLRSPFGDVPLSADIYEEGKEKKREVLEVLMRGSYSNVIFAKG